MNTELKTSDTEPNIPIEIRGGQPACSKCGGTIQCSGTVTVSFVNVDADCYEDDGEVSLTYDWADAGAADFVPTEFHCTNCGAKLYDPGDLRCDDEDEGDERE